MSTKPLLALLAAFAGLMVGPTAAVASSGNVAATQAYIQADYALVRAAGAHLATSEAAPVALLAQVQRECPGAAAESPQDPESTDLSTEVIGAMVIAAARPDVQAVRAFIGAASHLSWSNGGLTSTVRTYVGNLRTLLALPAPNLCADVKAWAVDGFHALPASTLTFVGRFMPAWVAFGLLPTQLRRYEGSEAKAVVRRAEPLETRLIEGEARAVARWGDIMNTIGINP